MHCIHCGALLPEGAKYCSSCGERVQVIPTEPVQERVAPEQPVAAPVVEEPVQEHVEAYVAPDNASEGYKAANAQLPPAYSNPNYSSQAKSAYTVPASTPSNGLAIAGFVCSLIFWPFTIGIFTAIAGFILSIMGLNSAKKLPENKGHGLALAGTIISVVRLAVLIIAFILLIAALVWGIGYAGQGIISDWSEYVPYYH